MSRLPRITQRGNPAQIHYLFCRALVLSWPHPPQSGVGRRPRAIGPDENQTRALQPVRWRHWTLKHMQGGAAPVRWLSPSLQRYECFISRFTIFCLIGRPWRPEPLCAYCYILMQPILLFCSAFMFISAFSPWKGSKHVPHSSPMSLSLPSDSLSFSFPAFSALSKGRLRLEFIVR